MTRLFFLLSISLFIQPLMAQDKPAYQLFNKDGKNIKYKKLLAAAEQADIIFFGELHNNPIAHWLQLELARDLHEEKREGLLLGAEMFEADNQILIDEYFAGTIDTKAFEEEARLWNNYKTDYKPLLELARENGLRFIATNIPRRYANLTYRKGFEGLDSLSVEAKTYIAPLPIHFDIDLPGYKNIMEMMAGHGDENSENFPKAQAAKDATMAHFISRNWEPGKTFLHFNGSYHSDGFEGIIWHLRQYEPGVSMLSITTVEQASLEQLEDENNGKADFILVVDEDMTKSY
ncbi:MAG: ChaN family lipoprotein [Lewinellaceae bacterium]|nr:ChaN family lipoprotein [Phaeodactylibacter sp.]MCB9040327.1 ChaN family lipoprotein [Lewinellaceae bacterium]